ncbi:CPCC family cysteine-rich protein [Rhizobacter sp. OV335]|uniref:CPCC family cysteine-rich protein n=1 Tax=Rhizobacter sp. OV335 TaxID=1500264 RepID=UPI00116131D8|nr:CPCC family cysteine-rich protein [Rhizobacter sp. OV335]
MSTSIEELHPCPCCGSRTLGALGSYEICEVCGWEDDPVQSTDPDYAGGANHESLNSAREKWKTKLE